MFWVINFFQRAAFLPSRFNTECWIVSWPELNWVLNQFVTRAQTVSRLLPLFSHSTNACIRAPPLNKYLSQRKDYLDRVWAGHVSAGNKTTSTNSTLIKLAECVSLIQSVSLCVLESLSLSLSLIPHYFFSFHPHSLKTCSFASLPPAPSTQFRSWWPPRSVVCLTMLSVAVCQSHINSQPLKGFGGAAGRKQEENYAYCVPDWCVHIFTDIYGFETFIYVSCKFLLSLCG